MMTFNRLATAQLLVSMSLLLSVSGCSTGTAGPSGLDSGQAGNTVLISYTQHQKDEMERTGNALMGGMADTVQRFPLTASAGEDFDDNQEAIWIEGKPLKGLKVILQGNAFSQGVLGPPRNISAEVRDGASNDVKANAAVMFTTTGANSYSATFQNLNCLGAISFDIMIPALKAGESNYEVLVAPVDASLPPVTLKRNVLVSAATVSPLRTPETSASAEPNPATDSSPDSAISADDPSQKTGAGEGQSGTTTTTDANPQPQTTFDMGRQGSNP